MKVAILAGGFGSRLSEETSLVPKPMIKIGGKPILWHIMNTYAHHGMDEFVIALGYLSEVVKEYFLHFYSLNNDLSIDLSTGQTKVLKRTNPNWKVDLRDTGANTQTGGRIKRLRDIIGNETFCLTYGDGVADIDVAKLLAFHRSHGKLATVTAVRPPARFGELVFDGDQVSEFVEKPHMIEGWINGGYFILEPGIFDYIDDDDTIWERGPLERLAKDNQLCAYKHDGFWQPMDTLREKRYLEELWASGNPPWKVW